MTPVRGASWRHMLCIYMAGLITPGRVVLFFESASEPAITEKLLSIIDV